MFELARHRDQAFAGGRKILACRAAPPCVGARASVREDAAGDDEPVLVLGTEAGDRRELVLFEQARREVELGLDVSLGPSRPDVAGVTLGAEQQADRLRENRLARPGLARDRVEPGGKGQLGLLDQDEVLDAQATEHGAAEIVGGRAARHHGRRVPGPERPS